MECKREHFLYNPKIAEMAAKIANASWEIKQESTLILVEELVQISMLSKLLKVPFGYIHSGSKKEAEANGLEKVKQKDQIKKFNEGVYKVLIGTKAIATGTNLFPTHNTVNWMGGGSEIVTKQGPMGTLKAINNIKTNDIKPTISSADNSMEPPFSTSVTSFTGSGRNGELLQA